MIEINLSVYKFRQIVNGGKNFIFITKKESENFIEFQKIRFSEYDYNTNKFTGWVYDTKSTGKIYNDVEIQNNMKIATFNIIPKVDSSTAFISWDVIPGLKYHGEKCHKCGHSND